MKKYYIGLSYLLIGILAAAIYAGIDIWISGDASVRTLVVVVIGVMAAATKMVEPVTPWSVFSVDGSIIKEERLFEKAETRQADLSFDGIKLYKWQATNGLWLIASEEELAGADAAKAFYKQKKAVMVPVNNQLKDLLESWVDQAKNIN